MSVDRAMIRERLLHGDAPDSIAAGNRETHHAVREEQGRLGGELRTITPPQPTLSVCEA